MLKFINNAPIGYITGDDMKQMRKLEVVLEERRYWNNELMRHYSMSREGCENKDRIMYFSSRIKEIDLELKMHNYTGKLMKVA